MKTATPLAAGALAIAAAFALALPGAQTSRDFDALAGSITAADLPAGERVALILDLDDRLSERERARALARVPGAVALNSEHSAAAGLYRVELPAADAAALMHELAGDRRFEAVEPDLELQLDPTVARAPLTDAGPLRPSPRIDDPLYPFQWHLDQIRIEDAWTVSRGRDVVVAVVDTGVAYGDSADGRFVQVRDLAGTRFVPGYDFVDDNDRPYDEHGHGTHVAGTIAQTTNNGYGVAGVAPDAIIMPIRVLDAQGRGRTGDIADAIRWAADNGAHVINLSLGGPLPSRVLSNAVAYAHRKGVVVIAAAGNSGSSRPGYPAAYSHVIGVAATQYDRTTTFYSNWGKPVDIAAPGGNTRVDQNGDGRPDGVLQETIVLGTPTEHEFAGYMGTSMASPHVAGVAALIRATGVTHPDRIEAALLATASRDVPSYDAERYGAGLLDAAAAVRHTTRSDLPLRTGLAWLGALALAGALRRRSLLRPMNGFAYGTAAVVAATGLAPLVALLDIAGFATGGATLLASSPLHWAARLSATDALASFLVVGAAPVLALYSVFGGARRPLAVGLLAGTMAGLAFALVGEAARPLHDVTWIPGVGLMDRLWLGANGLLALALTAVALRRSAGEA